MLTLDLLKDKRLNFSVVFIKVILFQPFPAILGRWGLERKIVCAYREKAETFFWMDVPGSLEKPPSYNRKR